jgi:hypothetical protein
MDIQNILFCGCNTEALKHSKIISLFYDLIIINTKRIVDVKVEREKCTRYSKVGHNRLCFICRKYCAFTSYDNVLFLHGSLISDVLCY